MPAKSSRIPKYRLHKTWGLAVVRLNGRDIYLGKQGTPESQAELGVSWVLLVASELIASTNGLGWLLNDARNFSRPAEMLAACLSISACGILTDIALARAQRYFGRWDTRFRAE